MNKLHEKLKEKFPDIVLGTHEQHGDETVVVKPREILNLAKFLKEDAEFDMNVLMDMSAVDGLNLNWNPRFQAVYHFYSLKKNHRLRVKVPVELDGTLPSLSLVYPIANWFERECWDMFGIKFEGHPNLKRLLMYEEFQGHPLRKDYPINKRQPLIGPQV